MALAPLWEKPALLVRGYIIKHAACVHLDETLVIIAGKIGYAWLVCWGPAAFVVAGSGAVPDVFSGMRDIPSVTDGYAAYAYLPEQSCLIHMLRRAEKCAVRSGKGPDLIPCLPLLGMHSRVKRTETAPPGPRRNRRGRCGRSPTCTGRATRSAPPWPTRRRPYS